MKFILPPYKNRTPISGVYKITIDDKWFYIGSSQKVKARIRHWKNRFNSNEISLNIKAVLSDYSVIKFDVIENILDKSFILIREDFYIKKYFYDPFCLNHCPSAFDNKGIEKTKGVKPIIKIKGIESLPKRVGKFSMDGTLIERFHSVYNAAKVTTYDRDAICDVMKGRSSHHKGFLFKEIDTEDNIINNVDFIKKKFRKV